MRKTIFKAKFILILMLGMILLALSVNGSLGVTTDDVDTHTIDVTSGYTSETLTLAWDHNMTFEFETSNPINLTFELLDLNGSLFMYQFDHHDDHHSGPLMVDHRMQDGDDGDHMTDEHMNMTHDGFPMGLHVEEHVRRHLMLQESGNFSLELSNSHPHPADTVEFKVKFSVGQVGDEILGTVPEESPGSDNAPGFEFLIALAVFPALGLLSNKRRRKS
ncbi:MAG: Heimdall-CTERM domain-containing surface protein [Candidatus Hodarchaeales archaeon]|jgi:hypothetical protein